MTSFSFKVCDASEPKDNGAVSPAEAVSSNRPEPAVIANNTPIAPNVTADLNPIIILPMPSSVRRRCLLRERQREIARAITEAANVVNPKLVHKSKHDVSHRGSIWSLEMKVALKLSITPTQNNKRAAPMVM